ncbi:MAG: tRNA (adenosine(37)-N6)-threonylcarbamoyltransferase complex ATPase subunit type 1 TsaE [Campylobacteraceae bacterium]
MKEFVLKEDELEKIVLHVKSIFPNGGIILLQGDLASGKTTLVKEFALNFGLKKEDVSSPTFSIMNVYKNGFFHYDIYNSGFSGMLQNGLFENLEEEGWHFVEWGESELEEMLKKFEMDFVKIEIITKDDNKRIYKVNKCIN